MSKVISFSISDRYLSQVKSLYPSLTDNLAVKQFVTDRLNASLSSSLDDSLDGILDERTKTLIETWVDGLLEVRLDDAVKKSIGELTERLSRLESRLDDNLDGRLDDMEQLLRLQREASIATSPLPTGEPSPLPPSPDEQGTDAIETDDREWLSLQQIAEKKIKGLPGTQQGLRLHAKNWESRKNPQKRGEQYKIPKEYL